MKNNQHNSVEENSRNRSQNNQILGGGIKSNIPVNGSDKRHGVFIFSLLSDDFERHS